MNVLLRRERWPAADRLTIAGGHAWLALMERAGRAVADVVARRCTGRSARARAVRSRATTAATASSPRACSWTRGYRVELASAGRPGRP